MNNHPSREETLFSAAAEMATPEMRAAFLDRECAGDAPLRARVEALLKSINDENRPFMRGPALPDGIAPIAEGPGGTVIVPVTEKAGDRIGRYKLLQQIGEGGCGVVYMAEQEEPVRRRVALKVIKLGMDTKQVVARFEAERQALAMMDHQNIAKVLDAGATDPGRPFFVMELVRCTKITEFCDQQKLSTRERLDLFIQVCHAIQHAHQKGIIHRDLKPSNILVTMIDGQPVPKVIDFGIAKATNQQRLTDKTLFTAFEQFIGTPAYMSPEQAEMSGVDIDTRSDIYSLGVLLYELLTGRTPFDAGELHRAGLDEIRRIIREVEPPKPSTRLTQELVGADVRKLKSLAASGEPASEEEVRASSRRLLQIKELIHLVRGDLDWIVMKCLEKSRAHRYETANALGMDLQCHLGNEPIVARPPSNLYRLQKLIRRNKLAFAAAGAVVIALLLGVVVSGWQAVRATRAEREQRSLREEAVASRQKAEAAGKSALAQAERAEASAIETKMTLAASDFSQAVRLITEGNRSDALAYLTRSLSANPTNDAALSRLGTLLTYHSWTVLTLIFKHNGSVRSAQFSPDGKRIVTASGDFTARVWDAQTGQALMEPVKHSGGLNSAQFSPDGKRIVTASEDRTARVWDVVSAQPRCPEWLLQLCEAISGQVMNKQGVLEETKLNCGEVIKQIREKLSHESGDDDRVVWGRWFLADPFTRTISPFSKLTVPEYIENRIKENTPASLAEAEELAAGNTALLERIARARSVPTPGQGFQHAQFGMSRPLGPVLQFLHPFFHRRPHVPRTQKSALDRDERMNRVSQRSSHEPGGDDWVVWVRWFRAADWVVSEVKVKRRRFSSSAPGLAKRLECSSPSRSFFVPHHATHSAGSRRRTPHASRLRRPRALANRAAAC